MSGLQLLEARVLQAEALGDGERELVVVDDPALEQKLLHRPALRARVADDGLDRVAVAEAEVDEHVPEQPPGALAGGRGLHLGRRSPWPCHRQHPGESQAMGEEPSAFGGYGPEGRVRGAEQGCVT